MPDLIARFAKEGHVIADAPFSFATAVALAAVVIWGVVRWRFQAIVEHKNGEVALLQRQRDGYKDQRDSYKEKLGGASPDEAKARIEELERRLGPLYPLTPAQEERLASALTRTDAAARFSVSISSPLNAAEPGERMTRVFERSGWTVNFEATAFLRGEASGIFVLIPKEGREAGTPRPPAAKALLRLFDEAGVEARLGEQDLRPDQVILVVARAPI